jgi:hypothetical protein
MQLTEVELSPHLLTAAEYMTLDIEDRTELLGGMIFDVSPRHEPHRYAVSMLDRILAVGLPAEHMIRCENAIAVPGWKGRDAPEVDVAVVVYNIYELGPTAADSLAFIEVSDTTYRSDRGYKIPLYVNAGVPAWIVNIRLRQVEFYGSPADLELPHGHVFGEHDSFDVLGVKIPVARLLLPSPTADV